MEILCCCGSRADSSLDIANSHAARHPGKIRVLRQADGHSAGGNRNLGLDSARGEHLMFMDADDTLAPDMLEKMLEALVRRQADMVCCAFDRREAGSGTILGRDMNWKPTLWNRGDSPMEFAFVFPAPWGKLYRRDILNPVRFIADPKQSYEDLVFFLDLIPRLNRFFFLPDVLYHYRVSPTSFITTASPQSSLLLQRELIRIRNNYQRLGLPRSYQSFLCLAAFIHAGVSATHRLAARSDVDTYAVVKQTRRFLDQEFPEWRNIPLRPTGRLSTRGTAAWLCAQAYRLHCFTPLIHLYNTFTHLTGRIVKW